MVPSKEPNYDNGIDFEALAKDDPDFAAIYSANNSWVNFKDPRAVTQLTISLLKRDFAIKLELPHDRLCPPVPIRWEYIKWIQGLLDSTSPTFTDGYDSSREIIGIDIGVGASCIYPLLGCSMRPQWQFYGTEIDELNTTWARKNVTLNNMASRIQVHRNTASGNILLLDAMGIECADFVMCNPPFYKSKEDMQRSLAKDTPPSAVCTGADVEMITEGGDAGFAVRIIEESKGLGEHVQWYTCMLGKLSSLTVVVEKLRELGCQNWAIGCLVPGNKTRRWVVGWSWGNLRPTNKIARGNIPNKELLSFPTEYSIDISKQDIDTVGGIVDNTMIQLGLKWSWDWATTSGITSAKENVWSRSARRKKRKRDAIASPEQGGDKDVPGDAVALVVRISLRPQKVDIHWLKGSDSIMFESFCGMLKRRLINNERS